MCARPRRSDGEDLLEETLRADISIAKLQKELSLKVLTVLAPDEPCRPARCMHPSLTAARDA